MSTKIKKVNGMISNGIIAGKIPVTVRFTSDKLGESLSLEAADIMIQVVYRDILPIIKEARKSKD